MAKRKSARDVHGIVLLDKRCGVSSNYALQEVRRLFNANKAGHTGSLDPLATGLLPLCLGEATKVSSFMLEDDKRYQVKIALGRQTDTGDSEGNIIAEAAVPEFDAERLNAVSAQFLGDIMQVPPMYSALKHQGRKLYELARQGQQIERPARPVRIDAIELLDFTPQQLHLDVSCSKGTYIRSLAEDIAEKLGTLGTVTELRRITSGPFRIEQSLTLQQLQTLSDEQLQQRLLPVDAPLHKHPSLSVDAAIALRFRQGQRIKLPSPHSGMVRVYDNQQFLGLGELSLDGKLSPKKIFLLDQTDACNAPVPATDSNPSTPFGGSV
jgi:tRNA pseudouridine55 synthase